VFVSRMEAPGPRDNGGDSQACRASIRGVSAGFLLNVVVLVTSK
jgi:hypothetical protein